MTNLGENYILPAELKRLSKLTDRLLGPIWEAMFDPASSGHLSIDLSPDFYLTIGDEEGEPLGHIALCEHGPCFYPIQKVEEDGPTDASEDPDEAYALTLAAFAAPTTHGCC